MQQKDVESKSDWAQARRNFEENRPIPYDPEDGPYDPNDEEATEAWLSQATVTRGIRGPQKAPTKKLISIRLSQDVVEHFKAKGKGWQTEMDRALRRAMGE